MLETNEKIVSAKKEFQQRNRKYKEKSNGNFRIRNITTKINSVDGLGSAPYGDDRGKN